MQDYQIINFLLVHTQNWKFQDGVILHTAKTLVFTFKDEKQPILVLKDFLLPILHFLARILI